MRKNEILALVTTAAVMALVLVGFLAFDADLGQEPTQEELAPEQHALQEDAPSQVQRPTPSEVGEIDEP